jgi:hypothetical protein
MAKRVLQIFRDGLTGEKIELIEPLKDGEQGNFQTLGYMAEIVRNDRTKADLRRFVLREIVGSDVKGHDFDTEIKRIFEFTQKQIVYRKDPVNVERVMDIWSTLYGTETDSNYSPEGDCGIKSVFLASCLALIGHKPVFVIIKQSQGEAFNHVYNGVNINGKVKYLDATPEEKPIGYQPKSLQKFIVPIF